MGILANRIWHVALARVEAGTMFNRWHGWGTKDTKPGGGRLVESEAETGVDQWSVPIVDPRHLDIDALTSPFLCD